MKRLLVVLCMLGSFQLNVYSIEINLEKLYPGVVPFFDYQLVDGRPVLVVDNRIEMISSKGLELLMPAVNIPYNDIFYFDIYADKIAATVGSQHWSDIVLYDLKSKKSEILSILTASGKPYSIFKSVFWMDSSRFIVDALNAKTKETEIITYDPTAKKKETLFRGKVMIIDYSRELNHLLIMDLSNEQARKLIMVDLSTMQKTEMKLASYDATILSPTTAIGFYSSFDKKEAVLISKDATERVSLKECILSGRYFYSEKHLLAVVAQGDTACLGTFTIRQ